jgi:urease accessory protein
MFDAASRSEAAPALARAQGQLGMRFVVRDGRTVLGTLLQDGCLRARFPRGAGCMAVTLNTAGGMAGGDVLDALVVWEAGASAAVAAAAAERVYRARAADPPARVSTRLVVGAGARAEWLPQETILFDGARLDRRLAVELAPDGDFLGLEALVFGRTARGERFALGSLADRFIVHRDGRPVLHDAIRLCGDVGAVLHRAATAGGAAAVASLVKVAPDAEVLLDALRAVLPDFAAASAWDGMLVARFVAPDGAALRRAIVAALAVLRKDPLPRTWLC